MDTHLIIDLANLPEEGKSFSGQLDPSLFDLHQKDAQASGPLTYDLWIQRFEAELLLTGSLFAPFQLTCVVTLKSFIQTIHLAEAAISVEIGNQSQIDISQALREEILIELPIDPRCDQGDVPEPCEIDSRYLAIDKASENGVSHPSRDEEDKRWSVLNQITGLNDHP